MGSGGAWKVGQGGAVGPAEGYFQTLQSCPILPPGLQSPGLLHGTYPSRGARSYQVGRADG